MKIEPFKTRGLTEIYRMDLRFCGFCGNGDTIGPKLPQVPRVGFCKMSRSSHCIFEEWNHFGWGRTCFLVLRSEISKTDRNGPFINPCPPLSKTSSSSHRGKLPRISEVLSVSIKMEGLDLDQG
jgi:hypothetical protein